MAISREWEEHGNDIQMGTQHPFTLEPLITSAGKTDRGEMNHSLWQK